MEEDSDVYHVGRIDSGVLEYSRMIVPPTMRSTLWKYFGFPADQNNTILTKQKIICTLCGKAIVYNRNTTNLRTHLAAKHMETLQQIHNQKKLLLDPMLGVKKAKLSLKREVVQKVENDSSGSTDENHLKLEDSDSIIQTLSESELMAQNSDEKLSESNDYNEYDGHIEQDPFELDNIKEDKKRNIKTTKEKHDGIVSVLMCLSDPIRAIADLVITDLLSVSFIESDGFAQLVEKISPNMSLPSRKEFLDYVNKLFERKSPIILSAVQEHTSSKPFSLGLDIWKNIAGKGFITIYVHYIEDRTNMITHFYKTINLANISDIESNLHHINLKNCAAIVVNSDNVDIENYFSERGIPVVYSLDYIINKCLSVAFRFCEDIIHKLDSILEEEFDYKSNGVNEKIAMTKYELCALFIEKYENRNENPELLDLAKRIVSYLTPLKKILEVLRDEPIVLSSLIKPLVIKLREQFACSKDNWSDNLHKMKESVYVELAQIMERSAFTEDTLTVLSFLDPRFQKHCNKNDVRTIKKILNEKFEIVTTQFGENYDNDIGVGKPLDKFSKEESQRQSSLNYFFDDEQNDIETQSSLEVDIEKYVRHGPVSLKQCPLQWWNEFGCMYPHLRKISEHYNCIPACIGSNYGKSLAQQIRYFNNRHMLSGGISLVNQILFLHSHRTETLE